ncbi:hypothetical protein [Xanthomonas albilineans]|uniref:hypothetical protein n=1 Tax=Xanthomonas albilineans TaxID=29447 RepID=UPI000B0C5919|nr:hypothetical protein [Xanthomonas albilineans]
MKISSFPVKFRERLSFIIVIFFVMAYKSNDALSNAQFWAEDGYIFFKQQFGIAAPQLLVTHFGYLHIIPRIVAWLAYWLPIAKAPLIYNACAIFLSATAITMTCLRLRTYIPPWVVTMSFLAVPISGEIFGTITNVQWFMQFVLATYCFTPAQRSSTVVVSVLRSIGFLTISLTGPFSIFLSIIVSTMLAAGWAAKRYHIDPFDGALGNFLENRDWHALSAMALGATMQAYMLASHPLTDNDVQEHLITHLRIAFTELVPIHMFGSNFLTEPAWILLYILVLGTLFFSTRIDGRIRLIALGFLALASLEIFASVAKIKDLSPLHQLPIGDRYFYMIKVVLWWVIWLTVATNSKHRTTATAITIGLICLFSITNSQYFRRSTLTDYAWRDHAIQLSQPGAHTIPINPNPNDWSFTVQTTDKIHRD